MLPSRWRDSLALATTGVALVVGALGMAHVYGDPLHSFASWLALDSLGLVVLFGGIWWMKGGRAGDGMRDLAIPLACASATPLFASTFLPMAFETGVGTVAVPLAAGAPGLLAVLLGDATAALAPTPRRRSAALVLALAGGSVAALVPLVQTIAGHPLTYLADEMGLSLVAWCALVVATLGPMALVTATRPAPGTPLAGADNPGAAWLLAASCTPGITVLPLAGPWPLHSVEVYLVPLWLVAMVIGRAVARRLAQARLQRDLVVTVTEAERSRLAAELHDVALQELTLLVRRLDASGDVDAAEMARSVSERLRELCGDLHLPILDELGAGPALEWLVSQVAAATGEDIRLERADPTRPPAGVELAVFRVAQEAVANAVKHGGPPVLVRYTTSTSAATLFVDDAGPGLDVGHPVVAPRPGHYGLASMQQRAEQIGALLAIRAWPAGGTRVSLEWKAS